MGGGLRVGVRVVPLDVALGNGESLIVEPAHAGHQSAQLAAEVDIG